LNPSDRPTSGTVETGPRSCTVTDVGLVDKGIELLIARSKIDQAREGVIVAIPQGNRSRPKPLLLAWMAASGHADGFLFRRQRRGDALTDDPMSDFRSRDCPFGATMCCSRW
jgi:hypothetical protein